MQAHNMSLWNSKLVQSHVQELPSPDDFTLRWAGADFFKNWGNAPVHGGGTINLDLSSGIAFAAKDIFTPPWDTGRYPMNEIYFNNQLNWHYNPITNPDEGDPGIEADGEFDFWSILLHEVIHMMSVNTHAADPEEVMYGNFSDGERRWEIKDSDKQLLKGAGYDLKATIPEPATYYLFLGGLLLLILSRRQTNLCEYAMTFGLTMAIEMDLRSVRLC